MKNKLTIAVAFLVLLIPYAMLAQSAEPPVSSSVLLEQYMDDLQTNPDDAQLRQRIITLVKSMRQAPQMPDKVIELQGEATAAAQSGHFQDAVDAFEKASLLAPWVANIYYDLAHAQESAKQYDAAVSNYKLYLSAEPPTAPDRAKIEEQIGVDEELLKEAGGSAQ